MHERQRGIARTTRRLLLAVGLMFGFGFALVPLYNAMCEVVGLNGKSSNLTGTASAPQESTGQPPAVGREVTVEFVANTNADLAWDFQPKVARMKVRVGETAEAVYVARNRAAHEVTGQAIPSVAPGVAAKHFHKIECFCFTEQKLAAGEQKDMTVRFRVDPDLSSEVRTVTLAYTFFDLHKAPADAHAGHAAAGG
ncbi:cytochrome c oxidase assembly protein [Immundisolibacter sp.]|jgi:cytochrome c oxidase assembly protein subunit 11|uniref:cytochrome c oxidase assembly protein n=1 Tax=Immundisolibacter sp. TaxID=1934948 RepID=UPI0019CEE24B|nr:cytochrome c oxidase assembly protein [Immundisolibacter sp.]MBC7162595.1 cytochrome c oxidase assembly protein [Immundisolibacter sp.]MEA3219474.1 Cytochrome c oxidase assembly protein CtaG [Immundisolibacter sp.]